MKEKNILEFLERTVDRYPDQVAVDDGQIILTWKELKELSMRFGTAFSRTVKEGKPIVFLMEKSGPVLAAMYGAVYAGCFYVIIDPSQPAARIRDILQVLEPSLVVTEEGNLSLLNEAGYGGGCELLKDLFQEKIQEEKLRRIRENSCGSDLLYGIFTSGSTGKPKGITVSHQAVIRFITHFTRMFEIMDQDRIANQAPFDFDVSVKDIYSSMMTGARLVLIPRKMFMTPSVLLDHLCEKKITIMTWAVSALCLLSSLKGLDYKKPETVRKILFSGEVMPEGQLKRWMEALPDTEFVNLYGPSEITCNCTYYRIPGQRQLEGKLPIGHPFPGREVFLLDEKGEEIRETKAMGEICVAGESLSEGYYHNQVETDKRFFIYTAKNGEKKRCYRTGDLGCYGEEGELYFGGRKDFQIKHMGHRIELEEIERRLEKIRGLVRSCCVLDEKKSRIVAFYVGNVEPADIRRGVKTELPVYMSPGRIVRVREIPLNKNGKLNREYFRNWIREERA